MVLAVAFACVLSFALGVTTAATVPLRLPSLLAAVGWVWLRRLIGPAVRQDR